MTACRPKRRALQNPSDAVQDEIGIPGVAEAAALAAAGPEGRLIHPKVKSEQATMALALAPGFARRTGCLVASRGG